MLNIWSLILSAVILCSISHCLTVSYYFKPKRNLFHADPQKKALPITISIVISREMSKGHNHNLTMDCRQGKNKFLLCVFVLKFFMKSRRKFSKELRKMCIQLEKSNKIFTTFCKCNSNSSATRLIKFAHSNLLSFRFIKTFLFCSCSFCAWKLALISTELSNYELCTQVAQERPEWFDKCKLKTNTIWKLIKKVLCMNVCASFPMWRKNLQFIVVCYKICIKRFSFFLFFNFQHVYFMPISSTSNGFSTHRNNPLNKPQP